MNTIHNHLFNGKRKYVYYSGMPGWVKKYGYDIYCSKCFIMEESYEYLSEDNRIESLEREANSYSKKTTNVRNAKKWQRHALKSAAIARIVHDCDLVRMTGRYELPKDTD